MLDVPDDALVVQHLGYDHINRKLLYVTRIHITCSGNIMLLVING